MSNATKSRNMPSILSLALSDGTPRQAMKVALVVGTILTLINQGDTLLAGAWPVLWKTALTYCVPYCVASYGAVMAKRTHFRRMQGTAEP